MTVSSYQTFTPGTKIFIGHDVNQRPIDPWQPAIILGSSTYLDWFQQFRELGGRDIPAAIALSSDPDAFFYRVSTD